MLSIKWTTLPTVASLLSNTRSSSLVAFKSERSFQIKCKSKLWKITITFHFKLLYVFHITQQLSLFDWHKSRWFPVVNALFCEVCFSCTGVSKCLRYGCWYGRFQIMTSEEMQKRDKVHWVIAQGWVVSSSSTQCHLVSFWSKLNKKWVGNHWSM